MDNDRGDTGLRLTTRAILGLAMAMASFSSRAAELPPAPVLDDVVDEEFGSGWYLRGDIGVVDQFRTGQGRDAGTAFTPSLVKARLDRGWGFGGGAGYQFSPWFRSDLTIDHRLGATFKGSRLGFGVAADRADFDATAILVNGYVDLPFWDGVTPYLGAGLGVSINRFDSAERQALQPNGSLNVVALPSRTETAFAWALMGGVAIDVAGNVKLDLGYRYTRLGDGRTRFDGGEPAIRVKDVATHEFRIGARVMLD